MTRALLAPLLAAALAACGADTAQDGGIRDFRETAQAIGAAATSYQADAAGLADLADCTGTHHGYDAEVRPMLEHMREVAAAMDAHMAEMGGHAHADMACLAQAMLDELDRHAGAACASPDDMGPNAAEAGAHAQLMHGWAEHQGVRADEMDAMMGGMGGGMHGGGMMGETWPDPACTTP